jgi:hypothetical protein
MATRTFRRQTFDTGQPGSTRCSAAGSCSMMKGAYCGRRRTRASIPARRRAGPGCAPPWICIVRAILRELRRRLPTNGKLLMGTPILSDERPPITAANVEWAWARYLAERRSPWSPGMGRIE